MEDNLEIIVDNPYIMEVDLSIMGDNLESIEDDQIMTQHDQSVYFGQQRTGPVLAWKTKYQQNPNIELQ